MRLNLPTGITLNTVQCAKSLCSWCIQETTLILWPFSRTTQLSWYQNVSILDFIGAKNDWGLRITGNSSHGQLITVNSSHLLNFQEVNLTHP